MSNCPHCTTLIKFPTDHNSRWYKCPECTWYVRELTLPNSGLTRVEVGKLNSGAIAPLLPGSFEVRPSPRLSTIPRNVIPIPQPSQQNQVKTYSATPAQSSSQARLSNPVKPSIPTPSLDQIRARRKQVAKEIIDLEIQNKNLLKDLLQEIDNQRSVKFIAPKLMEYSENREKFIEELKELDTRESTYSINKAQSSTQQPKVRYVNAPITKPIPFGYSAFVGIGVMIWFTLSIGIQQWEFKTVAMMFGAGAGIALIGWLTGNANR